jgi:hypothetical protein
MLTPKTKLLIALLLVAIGVAGRLVPHPWNFAPVAATGLFAGTYLGGRYALAVPLLGLFISDLFIGFYGLPVLLAVYLSFGLSGLIGLAIRKHKSAETVIGGSLLASVSFYLISNFAVWKFTPYYAPDLTGLTQSYVLALPFFRNTLIGDLFFTLALFGAYEAVAFFLQSRRRTVPAQIR